MTQLPLNALDNPIVKVADDTLSRRQFAETLSSALRRLPTTQTAVVGLLGPWGSGKTSIANMTVEYLGRGPDPRATLQLRVWEFTNSTRLSRTFLDQIGEALGKGRVESGDDPSKLRASLEAYSSAISNATEETSTLHRIARVLLGTSLVGGLVLNASQHALLAIPTSVVAIISAAALLSSSVAKFLTPLLKLSEKGPKSYRAARREIEFALGRLKSPLVIFVDDLDRLPSTELLEVLQLIRSNLDLPGLVFVLLCDERVVHSALDVHFNGRGAEYFKKMLQTTLQVPLLNRADLEQALGEAIASALGAQAYFDSDRQDRWDREVRAKLLPLFTDIREVRRFSSSLTFHARLFARGQTLEVDPIDLVVTEVLRVFAGEFYRELPRFRDLLVSETLYTWSHEEARVKERYESLRASLPPQQLATIEPLLEALFPRISGLRNGHVIRDSSEDRRLREKRVATDKYFDRYFHLHIDPEALTEAEIGDIVKGAEAGAVLKTALDALSARNRLESALEELSARRGGLRTREPLETALVLAEVCEQLPEHRGFLFESDALGDAARILHSLVERCSQNSERLSFLRTFLGRASSARLAVYFARFETDKLDPTERIGRRDYLLSADEARELSQIVSSLIARLAAEGKLSTTPDLGRSLWYWKQHGDKDTLQTFLRELTSTKRGVGHLIRSFRTVSVETDSLGRAVMREEANVDALMEFLPISDLLAVLRSNDSAQLAVEPQDEELVTDFIEKATEQVGLSSPQRLS